MHNIYTIDREKIFWRKVEDETVILNIDTGYYYALDETGALIWDMIAGEKRLEEITARITDEYDIAPKIAEKDMKALLENLEREKLIENK